MRDTELGDFLLCQDSLLSKPGRIGTMDIGKLICLEILQRLHSVHDEGLVMKQLDASRK